MGLETGVNYIGDLNSANPTGTDPKGQGDDHIRNVKRAAKQSFPGFTGAVELTAADTGSANAYVLTPTPALVSYTAGLRVRFIPANANTGASTINVSGLGAKALKNMIGNDLLPAELDTASMVSATYDGTRFLLDAPTLEYITQQALTASLPDQTGKDGKALTTRSSAASWEWVGLGGYAAQNSSPYSVDAVTDKEKLLDWTASSNGTFGLPDAATAGDHFGFYFRCSGSGILTLDAAGSDLIEGAGTYQVTTGDSGLCVCTGSGWKVALSRSTAYDDIGIFGDGSDGDVTITGSVTLTRDMYYNNLTLASGAALRTNGWRVFVKGILDLSTAPAGAISNNGGDAGNGSGTAAGAGGASAGSGYFAGANNAALSGSTTPPATPGKAVASNGGKGGANGANDLYTSVAVDAQVSFPVARAAVFSSLYPYSGSVIALQGGGNGTPGVIRSGGGSGPGGAGAGGGVIAIYARTISRGASTAVAAIQAKGGRGGSAESAVFGIGAGTGGGGGGGGWVYIVYRFLTGSTATNCIDVTGGNGGAGSPGLTINGGNGGASGEGGRVQLYDINSGASTTVTPVSSVAGGIAPTNPGSGTTAGGAGAAATTSRVSL